jgi:hypothetical protein
VSKDEKKAELIYDRWKADLKEMDRSRNQVQGNFELLFVTLDESKVSFDAAYAVLDKAIKAHYPPHGAVENTYRRLKSVLNGKTKQEFLDEWKDNISDAAKRAFYGLYTIEDTAEPEQKKYGSMSAAVYKKERAHAESFPILDWTKIDIKPMTVEDFDIDDLEDNNE